MFIASFVSFVITYAKTEVLLYQLKTVEADHFYYIYSKLSQTLAYVSLASNLFSCLVLALTVRFINKLTQKVRFAGDSMEQKRKFN